jgi:hypothetical protein
MTRGWYLNPAHPRTESVFWLGSPLMTTECNCIVCLRIMSTAGDDFGDCWSADLRSSNDSPRRDAAGRAHSRLTAQRQE